MIVKDVIQLTKCLDQGSFLFGTSAKDTTTPTTGSDVKDDSDEPNMNVENFIDLIRHQIKSNHMKILQHKSPKCS